MFGPFQIEARINQNTAISQQLSLWNQHGSRVIRGNLHVIPIEDSILYVSPLYLRAEKGQIPELKRVIAAYGDQVVMEETLPEALAALFRARRSRTASMPSSSPRDEAGLPRLIQSREALEPLSSGDGAAEGRRLAWISGAELNQLRAVLESSGQRGGGR